MKGRLCSYLYLCPPGELIFHPPGSTSHLSEELLQQGGGPVVVQVPVFGWVADVGRVQQQRQGFGFVNAGEGRIKNDRVHFLCPIILIIGNTNRFFEGRTSARSGRNKRISQEKPLRQAIETSKKKKRNISQKRAKSSVNKWKTCGSAVSRTMRGCLREVHDNWIELDVEAKVYFFPF